MSTEAPATRTVTWTVQADAAELIRAIRNVALFASTDDTLPLLTAIHFRNIDGVLVVEATNRHIAAQQLSRSAKGLADVMIYARDAVAVCAELTRAAGGVKALRGLRPVPQILMNGIEEDPLLVTFTVVPCAEDQHPVAGAYGPDTDAEWPTGTIDRRFEEHAARAGLRRPPRFPGDWRLDVRYLAKLGDLDDGNPKRDQPHPAHLLFTGQDKPVGVSLNDAAFRALIMPIRKADRDAFAAWTKAS